LIDPNELNVDGIYFDQMGGHRPDLCYDASHGHPLGGGNHWTDGYRSILETIANTVDSNTYLTIEMFAEPYVDLIHGFLVAHLDRQADDVPLVQAIYSGYSTSFGRFESKRDHLDTFAMRQGDSFLWGVMLLRCAPSDVRPEFRLHV
jgi:hypothetical protein